jgi:O-antigen ligase
MITVLRKFCDERRLFCPPQSLTSWVGLGGLAIWALSAGIDRGGINIGFALMVLAFLLQWRRVWPRLRSEPIIWAGLAFTAYLVGNALWASQQFPETAALQRRAVSDLMIFSGLPALPVAWWMGGDPRRVRWVLLLLLIGLTLGVLSHFNWANPKSYLAGARMNAVRSPNGLGLYSATVILGLTIFGTLFVSAGTRFRTGLIRVMLILLWVVLTSGYVAVLILTRSRSAWLAAAFVIVPAIVLFIVRVARRQASSAARSWRPIVFNLMGVVIAGALVIYASFGAIQTRFTDITNKLSAENPNNTSIAITARLELWKFGIAKLGERPVFGFGAGTAKQMIGTSEIPQIQRHRHFHNLYLHLLVTLGLVGLILAVVVVTLLTRAAWRSVRSGTMPVEFAYFLAGSVVAFLAASFFTIRHNDVHGGSYLLLLNALAYTFWIHRGVARQPDPPETVVSPSRP